MPTPDAVEPFVVEDFVLEGLPWGSRRRVVAVPREARVLRVADERRIASVPQEGRVLRVAGRV